MTQKNKILYSSNYPIIHMTNAMFIDERGTGMLVELNTGESLLHAAHRNGIEIPAGCWKGQCGTCACTDITHDEPFEVRTCQAVPQKHIEFVRIRLQEEVLLSPKQNNSGAILYPPHPHGRVEVLLVHEKEGTVDVQISSMVDGVPHHMMDSIKIDELPDRSFASTGQIFYRWAQKKN